MSKQSVDGICNFKVALGEVIQKGRGKNSQWVKAMVYQVVAEAVEKRQRGEEAKGRRHGGEAADAEMVVSSPEDQHGFDDGGVGPGKLGGGAPEFLDGEN